MELTIASYNIRKAIGLDRRRDPDRIISVLREIDADVIALQEVDRRIGQRASALPRALLDDTPWQIVPVAVRPRSIGWHGNALLVRRSISIIRSEPVDLPTLEPRGAISADLHFAGHDFRVLGAHLDLSGVRRRAQVKAMLADCERQSRPMPTVILGDFNQWTQQRGAMQSFGNGWRVLPAARSYPSRRPIARLDRMVISDGWECSNSTVHHSALATRAFDHLPLVAQLMLPNN